MQSFKEKLARDLKNDIRKLVNFHASSRKLGNLYFDGLLLSNAYKVLEKKFRGGTPHDTEEWSKILRKNDFWFQKWHEVFGKF